MYQVEGSRALLQGRNGLRGRRLSRVSRNVVLLGVVSFFTDVSSEMVATVLPLYVVYSLGLSPLAYGAVDGIYQGGAAVLRLGAGFASDRLARHKDVAAVGYGLSAVTRLLFLAVGSSIAGLTALVAVDRAGKAVRTAPRDALISLSTEREQLATAFGVHRALDTAGAMLGPLLAFAILTAGPLAFDTVFVVSFCFAAIGFAILVLFVRNPPRADRTEVETEPAPPVTLARAAGLWRIPGFRALVLVAAGLAVATLSDGFLYLALRERAGFDVRYVPLLFVFTALVYMLAAVPVGRLADRVGRGRVFLAGYAVLVLLYGALLLDHVGIVAVAGFVVLFGLYYAATDGVVAALASAVLPADLRASGLSILVAATSGARLVASVAFGALWTGLGIEFALVVFVCGLLVAVAVAAPRLRARAVRA